MRIEINYRTRLLLQNIADGGLSLQGKAENCEAVGAFKTEDLIDMARSAESVLNNLIILKEIEKKAFES